MPNKQNPLQNRKRKINYPMKPYLVVWMFLCPIIYIAALLCNFVAIRTFYIAITVAGLGMLVFALLTSNASSKSSFHPDNQRGLFNMISPKELAVLLVPLVFVILVDAIASIITGQFF